MPVILAIRGLRQEDQKFFSFNSLGILIASESGNVSLGAELGKLGNQARHQDAHHPPPLPEKSVLELSIGWLLFLLLASIPKTQPITQGPVLW